MLKDPQLRQALAQAIDRQALVDKVLGGLRAPASTIIPPMYRDLHLEPAEPRRVRPREGQATLDAAGYKVGADGVRVSPDGKRMSLRLLGRQESSDSQKSVEFVKGWLAAVGIEVKVKVVSEDTLYETHRPRQLRHVRVGLGRRARPGLPAVDVHLRPPVDDDDGTIFANLSDSFYCDAEYDELYAQQSCETDPAKRTEIVKQMQQMLYDSNAYVVTFYYDNPTPTARTA